MGGRRKDFRALIRDELGGLDVGREREPAGSPEPAPGQGTQRADGRGEAAAPPEAPATAATAEMDPGAPVARDPEAVPGPSSAAGHGTRPAPSLVRSAAHTSGETGGVGGAFERGVPRYRTFKPFNGRIREDQYLELVRISSALNRRKRGGERITTNTLVRVGLDLLLSREEEIVGASEDEIRTNLGVPEGVPGAR